ncbi:DUF4328 domain-containing protein [Streptomyces sp. NPDC086010]|uniref:DUF4328 domain-containing protein n=1 Tax=Streptomyces sp. NPDC086010 TaxID=3365745 RepID=UPI0037D900A2
MTGTARKTPWILARSAQAAIAAAAVADVFRVASAWNHAPATPVAPVHTSRAATLSFSSLMLVAVVLFLVWLARSRRNALKLSPGAALPGGGWTVGAWFIPLVNLVAPRRVVLGIGRAGSESWDQKRDTTLVNLWWAALIAHGVLLTLAAPVTPAPTGLLVVAEVLMIAAAVLMGLVIERITALQTAALDATAPVAAPTPA